MPKQEVSAHAQFLTKTPDSIQAKDHF